MAITQATSSVLAANAALNNLNAGASIAFTKPLTVANFTIGVGSTAAFNATSYTYGTGAATAHRTALSINNVDNTSDLNKPISTATQTALNLKSDISNPVRTTLTGNGSTSVFAISGAGSLTNPSALIVAIDGALQEPSVDYTVNNGIITFTDPLANGAKAVVVAPTNTLQLGELVPSDGSVTSGKLAPNLTLTTPTINSGVLNNCTGYSFQNLVGIQRAIRTSDLSRPVGTYSSAQQIDPVLTLNLSAGNIYRVRMLAQFVGTGGAQCSAGINGPNSEFAIMLVKRSNNVVLAPLSNFNPFGTIGILNTVANQNQIVEVEYTLKPLVNGATNIAWWPYAGTGSVSILAGSYIESEIIG